MERKLTPAEKGLIEREFVARQEEDERRKRRLRFVFGVGFATGCSRSFVGAIFGVPTLTLAVGAVWLICVLVYTGAQYLPRTLIEDLAPFGKIGRWQRTFYNLGMDDRLLQGLLLVCAPFISRAAILVLALIGFDLISSPMR